MREIIGNTTATPNPRPDWNQSDEKKADYIRNKPNVSTLDDGKTKVGGDLVVDGDVLIAGETTTLDTVTLCVQDNIITTNADGAELIELGGYAIKTDANNAYGIMYDPTGDGVKIGLGTFDETGKFEYADNEAQFLATRADTIADGHTVIWDGDANRFVDSGYTVRELIGLESQTIATFQFEEDDSLQVEIKNLIGLTKIEWGDGQTSFYETLTSATHTYPSAGTYTCILYGVRELGEGAFLSNTNLYSIVMSNRINTLGNFIFRGCSNLQEVKLSNTATSLGDGFFYGCTKLKQITIPANIAAIGGSAFYKCTSLVSVEFENDVPAPYVAGRFKHCAALSKIIVPYNSIEDYKEQWVDVTDKITAIAYTSDVPQDLIFGYRSVTANTQYTIKRNGYYMCYSNSGNLKLCQQDGTVVVEGAKQIQFMAAPLVDNPTSNEFKVCGMYWSGSSVLSGVEGFRRDTNDGGYITADTTFYVSQMVKE